MAQFQNTVTDLNVMRGNAVVELAAYTAGEPEWVDVGAIVGLKIEPDAPVAKEENDNADATERFNKIELKVSFTQIEILKLEAWEILYKDLFEIKMNSNTTEISGGHLSAIPQVMIRLTTINDSKLFQMTCFKCTLEKLFGMEYKKDDADDNRIMVPVELKAKSDSNRANKVFNLEANFNG